MYSSEQEKSKAMIAAEEKKERALQSIWGSAIQTLYIKRISDHNALEKNAKIQNNFGK